MKPRLSNNDVLIRRTRNRVIRNGLMVLVFGSLLCISIYACFVKRNFVVPNRISLGSTYPEVVAVLANCLGTYIFIRNFQVSLREYKAIKPKS